MGIRNAHVKVGVLGMDGSLPLMGIRNSNTGVILLAALQFSLPLMGIRNLPSSVSRFPQHNSLPLMGIRNPLAFLNNQAPANSHYPSWGLGMPYAVFRHVDRIQLITPHGD